MGRLLPLLLVLALALFMTLWRLAPSSAADTLNVPADYSTIQAAIDAAADGDTVQVAPGTYLENIDFLGKDISVVGDDGPSVTIIDGQFIEPVVAFRNGESADASIEGFTIRNGAVPGAFKPEGAGIQIRNSSPTITGNDITANFATHGAGIGILENSAPTITANNIHSNIGAGISTSGYPLTPIIEGNTIANNDPGGINVHSAALIRNNTIANNGGRAIRVTSSGAIITQNLVLSNLDIGAEILLTAAEYVVITNNTFANNTTNDQDGGSALYFHGIQDSDTVVANNILYGTSDRPLFYSTSGTYLAETVHHNNVFNPGGPEFGGGATASVGVFDNITVDPGFADALTDFHLEPGSASIDAGDNAAPGVTSLDFEGSPRVTDGSGDAVAVIDQGAFEAPGIPAFTHTPTPSPTPTSTPTTTPTPCGIPDADNDGVPDCGDNCVSTSNPGQENNDRNFIDTPPLTQDDGSRVMSDSAGDACDPDDDNDGLTDVVEAGLPGAGCPATAALDPTHPDSDGDGAMDGAECAIGTNPNNPSAAPAGENKPTAPQCRVYAGAAQLFTDTDGDLLHDRIEACGYGTSATVIDSDGDTWTDGCEVASLNMLPAVNSGDQLLLGQAITADLAGPFVWNADLNKDGANNSGDQLLLAGIITAGGCPTAPPVTPTPTFTNTVTPTLTSECFAGETLISMADGSTSRIDQLEVGDAVMAWDVDAGHAVEGRVADAYARTSARHLVVRLANGEELRVTPEHPFFDPETGEYREIKTFEEGDAVAVAGDGGDRTLVETTIASVRWVQEPLTVYNLHVDAPSHNYFANGVLVHNKTPTHTPTATPTP